MIAVVSGPHDEPVADARHEDARHDARRRHRPDAALRAVVRALIQTGAPKLTLASAFTDRDTAPHTVLAAAQRLKDVVHEVLGRAQDSGIVGSGIMIEEVYLLIRGLAHASATMPIHPDTPERMIDIVRTGLTRRPPTRSRPAILDSSSSNG